MQCIRDNGAATWKPALDTFSCLGNYACDPRDTEAQKIKANSGADLTTCSSVQDGTDCSDYTCVRYHSHVINPVRNKIECRFGIWKNTDKSDYCYFCPAGQHKVSETHCEPCDRGKFLKSGEDEDLTTCRDCISGRFQSEKGQSECMDCPAGQFQSQNGTSKCVECPVGTAEERVGQSRTCRNCRSGRFQPETGHSDCINCPAGHKVNGTHCEPCDQGKFLKSGEDDDRATCRDCISGWYQPGTGQSDCLHCAAGQFQPQNGTTECVECPAGRAGAVSGQSECQACAPNQFQSSTGSTECQICTVMHACYGKGTLTPVMGPLFYIIIAVALLAFIFLLYKLVPLLYKAATAWKPQSKEDAMLAKEFVLPKKAELLSESIAFFKKCEKCLLRKGSWTPEDDQLIAQHGEIVLQYLKKRIQDSFDHQEIRVMTCCLRMDVLHDFEVLYATTMQNIYNKESDGFSFYTQVARRLGAAAAQIKCPPNRSELKEIYATGRAVYDRYHAFTKRAAEFSESAYTYTKGEKKKNPGMKGIYRVLEKGAFKYNDDLEGPLDFSRIRDLVRGGIIDRTMRGLGLIAQGILESDEVTVCRIKDRFNKPSSAGWTDCMINFFFNDDPNRHVCEVQLIHLKMLSQRTTQEGHDAYNVYRVHYIFE